MRAVRIVVVLAVVLGVLAVATVGDDPDLAFIMGTAFVINVIVVRLGSGPARRAVRRWEQPP